MDLREVPPIKGITGSLVRDEESGLIYSHARGGWPRLVAYADKGAPRTLHKVMRWPGSLCMLFEGGVEDALMHPSGALDFRGFQFKRWR
jgi:hypothetical protein